VSPSSTPRPPPSLPPSENLAFGGYRRDVYARQGHKMSDLVCCAGTFSWSPYQPNNGLGGSYAMACPTLGAGDPKSPFHAARGGRQPDLDYPQKGGAGAGDGDARDRDLFDRVAIPSSCPPSLPPSQTSRSVCPRPGRTGPSRPKTGTTRCSTKTETPPSMSGRDGGGGGGGVSCVQERGLSQNIW
jgi:hypothetical protein